MSILSDLKNMGLNDISEKKVYDDEKSVAGAQTNAGSVHNDPFSDEKKAVFNKKYLCPVCGETFESLTVMTGKIHVQKYEMDLRPLYDIADGLKYEVVACPDCGYAAIAKFFNNVTDAQARDIRSQISQNYKHIELADKGYYSYDDAVKRFELAMANAIVGRARVSEKAYLCLKTAWVMRGQREYVKNTDPTRYKLMLDSSLKDENYMLRNALEGFIKAEQSESYPIVGMNEATMDYVIAALFIELGEYDKARLVIGRVLISKDSNARIKEKMGDLREIIRERQGK